MPPPAEIHLAPAQGPPTDRIASCSSAARDTMSSSPEGSLSRSGGGSSDRDLKMASSSNTSPEGGTQPPLHHGRIRQVGVRPPAGTLSRIGRADAARPSGAQQGVGWGVGWGGGGRCRVCSPSEPADLTRLIGCCMKSLRFLKSASKSTVTAVGCGARRPQLPP